MLLLMMYPQLDDVGHCVLRRFLLEDACHLAVHMPAIGEDLVQAGPRQETALGSRVARADRNVIRIEQHPELRMEWRVTVDRALQYEGLEKPARMGEVPLRRTRVSHRLKRAVLSRERRGEPLGLRPDDVELPAEVAPAWSRRSGFHGM